jgi:hypothetical protein
MKNVIGRMKQFSLLVSRDPEMKIMDYSDDVSTKRCFVFLSRFVPVLVWKLTIEHYVT